MQDTARKPPGLSARKTCTNLKSARALMPPWRSCPAERVSIRSEDTAAIASVKVKQIPTDAGMGIEREIRMADKLKALELLGKHLGMFTDNVHLTGDMGVQIVDDIPDSGTG